MKNKIIILLVLLYINSVSALELNQNNEIILQEIYTNGEINQNCMIYNVSFQLLLNCETCTSTLYLVDSINGQIIINDSMQERTKGAFYYPIGNKNLKFNNIYYAYVTCYDSVSGNNGTVMSEIKVYESITDSINLAVTGTSDSISDSIKGIWEIIGVNSPLSISDKLRKIQDTITTVIPEKAQDTLNNIKTFGNIIATIINGLISVIKIMGNILIWSLNIFTRAVINPEKFWTDELYPFLITLLILYFFYNAIWFMFFESFIICLAIIKTYTTYGHTSKFFAFTKEYLNIHISIFKFLFELIIATITTFINLISMTVEVIGIPDKLNFFT